MTAPIEHHDDDIYPPPIGLNEPTFADESIGLQLMTALGIAIAVGLVIGLVILLGVVGIKAATP